MKNIFLILSLGILLISCAEDFDRFTPDPLTGDVQEFYDGLQQEFDAYIEDNREDVVVMIQGMTLVRIPALSFMDISGNPGPNIEVRVFTLDSAGDYIQNQIVTQDNEGVILPLLGIKIEVYAANGQSHTPEDLLVLRDDRVIQIQVSSPMRNTPVILNTYLQNQKQELRDNILPSEWMSVDGMESAIDSGYEFSIDGTEWYVLASEEPQENPVNITVNLPPLYDSFNSVMYAVTSDRRSVVRLENTDESVYTGTIYTNNASVELICISHQEDDIYHLGTKMAMISHTNMVQEVIIPDPASKGEIINFLDSL